MKKKYLLSLVCLVFIFGGALAMEKGEEEDTATLAAQLFKTLRSSSKKEQKDAVRKLTTEQMSRIKNYYWERLDDNLQDFLKDFSAKTAAKKSIPIFCYLGNEKKEEEQLRARKYVKILNISPEDEKLLEKFVCWQEKPFFVLISLLQIDAKTTPAIPKKKRKIAWKQIS